MDNVWNRLLTLTNDVHSRLDSISSEDLVDFVEQRERLVSELRQDLVNPGEIDAHWPAIQALLRQDEAIVGRMRQLKTEAERELKKTTATKKFHNAYESGPRYGGYFVDQRK